MTAGVNRVLLIRTCIGALAELFECTVTREYPTATVQLLEGREDLVNWLPGAGAMSNGPRG